MNDELVGRLRCQLFGRCPACVNWYTEEVEPGLWRERCVAIDAADAIEEMSRENESLAKSVNEASEILRKRWIPVAERVPKGADKSGELCENVWLFFDNGNVYPGWMNGITEKVYYLDNYSGCLMTAQISRVKMWQPRPQPPKEE